MFKSFFSVFTALLTILSSIFCRPAIPQKQAKDFVPVVRFMVCSDTHINSKDDPKLEKIANAINYCYDVADKDENYKKLDAVMFVGDCTNRGSDEQFDAFEKALRGAVKGDTEILAVVAKNHDSDQSQAYARQRIERVTGHGADFNVNINGFHFIGISTSEKDGIQYSVSQKTWLEKQLKQAKKEDGKKPIFVCNHEHVLNTVYGSGVGVGWGILSFKSILSRYPQVVHFSGHSHYPVNDPRSIWQGSFTAIGTGSMSYMELNVDSETAYTDDCWDFSQALLVEVDADNQVRVRGIDFNNFAVLCDRLITEPSNPDTYAYTPKNQKALSTAPVFPKDAELTAEKTDDGYDVTVPAAIDTDGNEVFLYRITVYNKRGKAVQKDFILNNYWAITPHEEFVFHVEANPEFSVAVYAENMYELKTETLTCTLQ